LGDPDFDGFNPFFPGPAHVDLREAKLSKADLRGAVMYAAVCVDSDFTDADLKGVDLREADLTRARFIRSRLTKARVTSAVIGDIQLADLRGAPIPSTSLWRDSTRTEAVPPDLAEAFFLRFDAGHDKVFRSARRHSCFISYSHADRDFALRLYDSLKEAGVECWLDVRDILPGQRILESVKLGISCYERVLLCCSRSSLSSWWVKDEIRKAQERERRTKQDIIIPLNLDDYLFTWDDGVASDIRSRLAADFRNWATDEEVLRSGVARLLTALTSNSGLQDE
jgi:hypothetical protein